MPLKGLKIGGKYLTAKQVMELAKKEPLSLGLAPKTLAVMVGYMKDRPDGFSITELFSNSKRNPLLKRMINYYSTPEKMWYSARGTIVHEGYASIDIGTNVEERLFMELPSGIEVSGQPDDYDPETGVVTDYKTSSSSAVRKSHVKQINGYAVLLREAGFDVNAAHIAYTTFKRQRLVEVPLHDHDRIVKSMDKQAQFLEDLMERRVVMDRDHGCHPACKYYCPFFEFCQQNVEWMEIPEGWTLWEGELVSEIPKEDRYEPSEEVSGEAED